MTSFKSHITNPKYLINMDETTVYLNCMPTRTVHPREEKLHQLILVILIQQGYQLQCQLQWVDQNWLYLLFLKVKLVGKIEKSLDEILPDGIVGYVQRKGWMDNVTMNVWYNKVHRPYAAGFDGESGKLLDDFKVHKNSEILELMKEDKTNRYMIPQHYTGLQQPCDVGINQPSKERLKKAAANWRREQHKLL